MGEMITNRTFALFSQSGDNALRNNPDTIDDLFRMAVRFVQRSPVPFFNSPFSAQLFECGIHGLRLDHIDAHRSITKFFMESIAVARSSFEDNSYNLAQLNSLFETHGKDVVWNCVDAGLFILSNNLRKDVSLLMFELSKVYPTKFAIWLHDAVQKLAQEHTLGATLEQLQSFYERATTAKRDSELWADFRELYKLYN